MILSTRNINKKTPDRMTQILDNCNLDIAQGEIVSIVGPSGAGKSSLLYCLGGLDDDVTGQVFLDGKDIYQMKKEDRAHFVRERVSFVFQEYNLLDYLNVRDNVLFLDAVKKKKPDIQRMYQILDFLGLKDFDSASVNRLSGGEKQRVALARTFYEQPQIVLADEPTGALDSINSRIIAQYFIQFVQQGTTVVLVTHDAQMASIANKVLFMKDGRIMLAANRLSAQEIQSHLLRLKTW